MSDLTALRTLAEATTPGPWWWDKRGDLRPTPHDEHGLDALIGWDPITENPVMRDTDASYIAALNPATVLRLLDALEAVLDEHPRYEGDFSDFCGHCQTRGEGTWPCPTVTALHASLIGDNDE